MVEAFAGHSPDVGRSAATTRATWCAQLVIDDANGPKCPVPGGRYPPTCFSRSARCLLPLERPVPARREHDVAVTLGCPEGIARGHLDELRQVGSALGAGSAVERRDRA